jgi:hypothetical protein
MRVSRYLRCFALAACVLMLTACARPAEPIGLTVIIARSSAATGSGQAIQSMEVDLAMQDGNSTFDAIYRVTRDGRMRIDIVDHGQRIYTEAYDGHTGWDQGKDGHAPFPDTHGDALWHGTQYPGNIFGLEDMQKNGHTLQYMGRETLDGVDYYVIKLTLSDGFETYRYVNPQSWLIERGRDFRAFHPAMDAKKTEVETHWLDFRSFDGVMRSFASVNTDLVSGKQLASQKVTTYKINPMFDPAIFVAPGAPAYIPAK